MSRSRTPARLLVDVGFAAQACARASWKTELELLRQLRHPNIVQLLGVIIAPPPVCLVIEFCAGGDLFEALRHPTSPGFVMRIKV